MRLKEGELYSQGQYGFGRGRGYSELNRYQDVKKDGDKETKSLNLLSQRDCGLNEKISERNEQV